MPVSMEIDAPDFVAISRALKAEKPHLRRELFRKIREAARPIVLDLRQAINSVDSQAEGSGGVGLGSAQRAAYMVGKRGSSKYGADLLKYATREAGRAGLRASIARSVRIVIKDSGFSDQVGVRIKCDTSMLPADQRKLPRYIDRGQWRHPVYGTHAWVTQTTTPNWFTDTTNAARPQVIAKVRTALSEAATHIASAA